MDDSGSRQSSTRINDGKSEVRVARQRRTLSDELSKVFDIEEIKEEVSCWKRMVEYLRGGTGFANRNNYFNKICGLCLAQPKEQSRLIKFRKTGLRRLNLFLINSTRKEVQSENIKLLTWCCLSLLSFYYSKNQSRDDGCRCFRKSKFDQSKAVFRSAMYLVFPEQQEGVIRFTVKYMTLTEQWNSEDYDFFVFQELLSMITKPELLLARIIKQVEKSQKELAIREALNISCTLSAILDYTYWDKYLFNHLLHNCFNTLLKIYLLCNVSVPSSMKVDNTKLREVIKTCMKYFVSNIKDNKGLVSVMDSIAKCLRDTTIVNEDRTEITDIIMFCAQRHHIQYFRESIPPDLLSLLLNNLQSDDKNLAMSSHKILHNLLDRQGNIKYFTEPVYYFKGRSDFRVNFNCSVEDIHFFKSFSRTFLDGIHHCFLKFCDKFNLVTSYITLCLVLAEVPEPVITIYIIHVVITTQNDVLRNNDLNWTTKAHIHAIAAALMSLVCVIHQDEVSALARYVEEVVRFRRENSPHLLPPLQNKYTVASHHTADYHSQLYFLEEEVLYALQRCWLGRRVNAV